LLVRRKWPTMVSSAWSVSMFVYIDTASHMKR
jgi:hypothetical protein